MALRMSVTRAALTLIAMAAVAAAQGNAGVPLTDLVLGSVNGVEATAAAIGGGGVKVSFVKTEPGRRLLPLQARVPADLGAVKALAFRYRLRLEAGSAPRLAVVAFGLEGASWVKLGQVAQLADDFVSGQVSLLGFRPTVFSSQPKEPLRWDRIRKLWFGLLLDGPARGALEVADACLTDQPAPPTKPLRLCEGAGKWDNHKDAAVPAALTTPNEGPGGSPCMKVEFTFPGGKHMFCNSSMLLPPAELFGYRALRMTYRATLPPGIGGLLVLLAKSTGVCYRADPMPPASAQWQTLTLPLGQFKLAEWCRDPDGKFDIESMTTIWIGAHGTSSGQGGPGAISVSDLELVP